MKIMKTPAVVVLACLLLAACQKQQITTTSIDEQNLNPLVAERYGNELADMLADLIIREDPSVADDDALKDFVQREITKAKAIARVAREDKVRGQNGTFISHGEEVFGEAVYVDRRLYFSPGFETEPGPNLRVYLTTAVDPREGDFPDETALDFGRIQSVYGAQTYSVPAGDENASLYRTVVLWDTDLERMFAFAQLQVR